MSKHDNRQSGIALIIGLVMLLLLTLIMMAAVKVTMLEEKMAGNLQNQNIAFQAAESALREAEARISSGPPGALNPFYPVGSISPFSPLKLSAGPFQNTTTPICVVGLCGISVPLQSESFPVSSQVITATTGIDSTTIDGEPEYIIEWISNANEDIDEGVLVTFRITARGRGNDNSLVQLQSTYRWFWAHSEFLR